MQLYYSFIHAFSIFTHGYWEALGRPSADGAGQRNAFTCTPVGNLQPSVHLTCVSEDERKLKHLEETRTSTC